MERKTILVIEDEDDILKLVTFHLIKDGYNVSCASSGEEGLRAAHNAAPHLILLDLMLPGIDGLEVCRSLKQTESLRHIPVVMLTAKGEEADIIAGLELGAEDYITKPFSPKVLLARIRTVLRRTEQVTSDSIAPLSFGELVIHPGHHEVAVNGQPTNLTVTEFRILFLLARKPGWVFTRFQIVDAVRGEESDVTERSVDVHIFSLRKKLGSADCHVETIRGVGYRFVE